MAQKKGPGAGDTGRRGDLSHWQANSSSNNLTSPLPQAPLKAQFGRCDRLRRRRRQSRNRRGGSRADIIGCGMTRPDEWERRFDELVEHYVREQQAALRQRARRARRAAETTVEAVRYELRTYGIAQLAKPRTQARLADFNAQQIAEMVASLRRMQPRYPAITEELTTAIEELKNG
jgi:N-acetyl-anhydromuramyl-L-alanine amidase AmpD